MAGSAAAGDLDKLSGKEFDHAFAHKMSMHHEMGIEMAGQCLGKAQSQDLKGFCQKTAAAMEQDVEKLETYREAKSDSDKTAAAEGTKDAMHQMHGEDMGKLRQASGAEFDRLFVTEMAKHHQQGMPDLQMCQQKASDAELKQLCQKMATEQQQEMRQLRGWQQAMGSASSRTGSAQ